MQFVRPDKMLVILRPTPFIIGIREAGSVDIDASSRNTTGKSATLRAVHAAVTHVVQIYKKKNP